MNRRRSLRRTHSLHPAALLSLFAAVVVWIFAPHTLAGQVPGGQLGGESVSIVVGPSPPPPPAVEEQAAPAPSSTPPTGPYSISGIVVSASTGAPLDRASVTLSAADETGAQFAEILTSETGAFRFDRLAAGKYRIRAYHRGYLETGYQEHEGFITAIVTGPDLDSQNLRYQLLPDAVIDGVVTSDTGEPVGGAQVTLFRQSHDSGQTRILRANGQATDDTGSFEFSRLRPGTYYIGVSASPWYAFHPRPKTDASGNALPPDQQPHSPLDVAYPLTFYPNATDSASAAPIGISAGDRFEANLTLHAVPAVHIQIQLPPPGPDHSLNIPQLSTDIFGEADSLPMGGMMIRQMRANSDSGGMVAELGGVAPGHYNLRTFGPQGEIRGPSVDLTTDQTLDFTAAGNTVDVSGKVAMASGQPLPSSIIASLVPAGAASPSFSNHTTRVSADGSFDFHSIPPGVYELQARAFGRSLAVSQMAASGADVAGSRVTVSSNPVLLAATLVSGSATITGYAKSGDRGIGGVMILLVPRDPNAGRELIRRYQSDSDGSFTLNRVVPGDYILVAIDNGWTLDWAQPDVIAPYLAHGLPIRIPADQKTLDLPTPLAIQSR